jgi:hypothetical protein
VAKNIKLKPVEVSTSPDMVHHLSGRHYEIKVSKHHRPAQIHRSIVPTSECNHDGTEHEVTDENAGDFDLRYVRRDLVLRTMAYFGEGKYESMTLNEMWDQILDKIGAPSELEPAL